MKASFNTRDFYLDKKLANIKLRVEKACILKATQTATKAENYMKANRPWKDRTGDAKRELYCTAKEGKQGVINVTFGHGVPYGTALEFGHAGRYEILTPTLRIYQPVFKKDMQDVIHSVFKQYI